MIDVAQVRSAVAAMPGDVVAIPKPQLAQLLSELETGQHARRSLVNIKTMAAIAASTSGAPVR